ncbi:M10 family metallopeptidase C-terminal domain-containing protein [Tropicibacter naphthalenivorans]|uniref:Serralysin C n=1 Tax=Tropicibacter naphthalenivorans TaxID=441103 RepID=A0A0P1GJX1_9RHOB|nr:M10 family metallopeptidase C-terminal domain-containing protein [Tropicibacter naphthalenivorans]CUH82440.1 Serralysin C precursor [Tropicibacter naphthalenivorans]SMD06133.1 Ca2+-binding protein, RTX toxin-related [Tropicibacter naphthalenivorans]
MAELGSSFAALTQNISGTQVELAGDDFANSALTVGSVVVGGTVTGNLETRGDRDWFALDLVAGQTVQISLTGQSLADPYLRLYSASGQLLDENDDAAGYDSALVYTATSYERVYVSAGAWGDSLTGSYQVEVAPFDPADPVAAITWGAKLASSSIDVYFAPPGYVGADGIVSEGWNAYEIAQVSAAFDLIEQVANVSFNVQSTDVGAEFVLVLDTNEMSALGYFYPPGMSYSGLGAFNGSAWDRTAGGSLEMGGYDFVTVTHELLHGMGLAHPHDSGGGSTVMDGVTDAFNSYGTNDLNQGVFTTMSYNTGFSVGTTGTAGDPGQDWGFEAGPMALDIGVLQEKYGANTTTAAGDDVYDLPDANVSGTYWSAVWDTGGTDMMRYSGARNVMIDLRAASLSGDVGGGGFLSAADGIAGGYSIANGVVIENAQSGSGDDTVVGNDSNNHIMSGDGADSVMGGAGDDWIGGGAGADTLDGGDGTGDTLDYSVSDAFVRVDLGGNSASGGHAQNDQIANFENVVGSGFSDFLRGNDAANHLRGGAGADSLTGLGGNDSLSGGASADTLLGGDGDDTLEGGFGDDRLEGGTGWDCAIYTGFGGGITINLNLTGAQNTGAAGIDTLIGIEDLRGGDYNDRFTGLGGDSVLFGGAGSDWLFGLGGNDSLEGGAGNDKLLGGAGNDTMTGEDGIDVLLGDLGEDQLFGGAYNDHLRGGAGSDTLEGGAGRDVLIGGDFQGGFPGDSAADVFVFNALSDSARGGGTRDIIRDFEVGLDLIDLSALPGTLNFIGTARFSGTAGELRYFNAGANTVIRVDGDGDGYGEFEIFANGLLTLTADDFVL